MQKLFKHACEKYQKLYDVYVNGTFTKKLKGNSVNLHMHHIFFDLFLILSI